MMYAKELSLTPSNISEVSMVVLRIDFFTGFLTAVEELQVKVNRGWLIEDRWHILMFPRGKICSWKFLEKDHLAVAAVVSKKSWAPGESALIPNIFSISSTEGDEERGLEEGLAWNSVIR